MQARRGWSDIHMAGAALLHASALDRALCPSLPGAVHFNVTTLAPRLDAVAQEERCAGFVTVGGLLPLVLDHRSDSYAAPWAGSARATLRRLCATTVPEAQAPGCVNALRASAECGTHQHCVSARAFAVYVSGADERVAWGRAPITTVSRPAPMADESLRIHMQRREASTLTVPSGAAIFGFPSHREVAPEAASSARSDHAHAVEAQQAEAASEADETISREAVVEAADVAAADEVQMAARLREAAAQRLAARNKEAARRAAVTGREPAHASAENDAVERALLAAEQRAVAERAAVAAEAASRRQSPGFDAAAPQGAGSDALLRRDRVLDEPCAPDVAEAALAATTATMEDFLLRSARRSPTAHDALRRLYRALDCAPSHSKLWYRFGFLLNRHAKLRAAATVALERAARLRPRSAGPSHAELTLIHLDRLAEAHTDTEEAALAREARRVHADAMANNPSIAMHTLKAAYGKEAAASIADAVAHAMHERAQRAPHRWREQQPASAPVALQTCEETRALRDVHRLVGDSVAADTLDAQLVDDLDGRTLAHPPYVTPGAIL